MPLYLTLLLCSVTIPVFLSFDKKLKFYKRWKIILPAIIIIALIFIIFDIYLTKLGVWGFNPRYHLNILLFNLPLEEWLFFLVIPYASVFIHFSFVLYFPGAKLNSGTAKILSVALFIIIIIILLLNADKIYTFYISCFVLISLILSFFDKTKTINSYYITFLLIMIPFFIVNAVLTGSLIQEEVVWYNNAENLGIRILTIPAEDFGYAFSLILLNLLTIKQLEKTLKTKYVDKNGENK
jgi:lycopene cyclase domain-containing protein